jgi:transposase
VDFDTLSGFLRMKIELDKINLTPKTPEETTEVIGQLIKIIIELKNENVSFREQLNNNSNNSSLPPSRDIKKKKKPNLKSGRKRGGQPGHKGYQRRIVPSEEVDAIVDCKPAALCGCGGVIKLKKKIQKHQVYEIPLPKYEVTEYRVYKGCCESCRIAYDGKLPAGVSLKGFGVRAQAMLSLLTSKYRLSKMLVQSWFQDVYQMPICLGSVSNVEQTVSQSLKMIHEEVCVAVQTEKIVHVDETGHKECNKSGWAWIASSPQYTYFMLNKSRGKKVAKEIIGNHQGRMIITDRYSAYNYLPSESHQICWAHLKRDFQKIADQPDRPGQIGNKLLKSYRLLFGFWKTAYKEGIELSKKQKKRLRRFKNNMLRWLVIGTECDHDKTARTCENILGFQHSLWHFFENNNISPTNNHAERQLRPLVISKKLTFGTQSDRGSRFIERIFTVITSCKQQGRDVLTFVTEAIHSGFIGKKAPSLVVDQMRS